LRRSYLEVVVSILETLKKHPNLAISRVMAIAGVNYNELKKIVNKGFIIINNSPNKRVKNYRVSPKGLDWLERSKQILKELAVEEEK